MGSPRARRCLLAGIAWACGVLVGCDTAPDPKASSNPGSRPSVLLITLDTTRADHLGFYGYSRSTSPVLDQLAAESLVFERATSTTSWTLPAHASMFTGKIPTAHGARTDPEGEFLLGDALDAGDDVPAYRASTIADAEVTLAERLGEAGYATAGVAGGPWLKRLFGLAAGFDHYDDAGVTTWRGATASYVTDAALSVLDRIDAGPFFLFANYFDPHYPYSPALLDRLATVGNPLRWLRGGLGLALLTNAYDGEIRGMDREVGRLLDALRVRGLYDDLLIVVTADHGELFGEAGRLGHGSFLSEAELHVPLLVKFPGGARAGEVVGSRVSVAGICALILEQTGLPVPDAALPSVLAPLHGPVVAETYPLVQQSPDGHWRALYVGNLKYLWNSLGRHELRDLTDGWDPNQNLIDRSPDLSRRLDGQLTRILAASPALPREPGRVRRVDAETREALKNLGYLR